MLLRPSCPRAGQSGLWQNWVSGFIGGSSWTRFGDPVRVNARWTRVFQEATTLITVPWGATRWFPGPLWGAHLRSVAVSPTLPGVGGDGADQDRPAPTRRHGWGRRPGPPTHRRARP